MNLTAREIDIIRHTAYGYTAKEVARKIGVEHRTVESYVASIKKKLGAKNVTHAVYIAIDKSMLVVS